MTHRLPWWSFSSGTHPVIPVISAHLTHRIVPRADRAWIAENWFPDNSEAQALFVKIHDFETDCRYFLNCFNSGLNSDQLVFSISAVHCFVCGHQLFKPPEDNYSQFCTILVFTPSWAGLTRMPCSIMSTHFWLNSSCPWLL